MAFEKHPPLKDKFSSYSTFRCQRPAIVPRKYLVSSLRILSTFSDVEKEKGWRGEQWDLG